MKFSPPLPPVHEVGVVNFSGNKIESLLSDLQGQATPPWRYDGFLETRLLAVVCPGLLLSLQLVHRLISKPCFVFAFLMFKHVSLVLHAAQEVLEAPMTLYLAGCTEFQRTPGMIIMFF